MDKKDEKISPWLIVLNAVLLVIVVLLFFAVYSVLHPKVLTKNTSKQDVTFAKTDAFNNISVNARAVYIYDVVGKKVIFQKNENAQLPLASLTKLMTALVATNLVPKDSHVTIRKEFLTSEGDSGLLANETWRLKDLLDFSLIVSSNDGAHSVASVIGATINNTNYSIGRQDFIKQMNIEAKTLGLAQTYFVNESGLDENSNQSGGYGSAADVSKLVEYMLENKPEILETTKYANTKISSLSLTHKIENTNTSINKIPGLLASKTGYTALAGGNLVVAFDSSIGYPIIVVVLGSTQEGRFSDVEVLAKASMKYIQGE